VIRHGSPPYLECSSAGDSRFSAFSAIVNCRSIEEQYQAAKVFADAPTGPGLHWKQAKGRRAINQAEVAALYSRLWDKYIANRPDLLEVLKTATGLSDCFGQPGHVCQADELWRIRCVALGVKP
jgi:hypothetical protein